MVRILGCAPSLRCGQLSLSWAGRFHAGVPQDYGEALKWYHGIYFGRILKGENMGTTQVSEPLPDDVEEGLCAFGRKLLDLVLKPEALAFHRLFIAEAPKFPSLAAHFIARNRIRDLIAGGGNFAG